MSLPLHKVNTLTGTKSAKEIDNAEEYAGIIKKAKNPLMVMGPILCDGTLGDNSGGWEFNTTTGQFHADDNAAHAAL